MMTQSYYIIECQKKYTGKAKITVLDATDFTDAILKFKAIRQLKKLPYDTMIIPGSQVNHYPKGV
jgi:hypothetical protein